MDHHIPYTFNPSRDQGNIPVDLMDRLDIHMPVFDLYLAVFRRKVNIRVFR